MLRWVLFGDKSPVQTTVVGTGLRTKYRTKGGKSMEIDIRPDPRNPATLIVKANGTVVGRVWVEDNGMSLGISDLISPVKYVD
jgi:hypothetical protein